MAEAIARAMIERRTGHRAHIASAGTAAGPGMPATENARLAVESLGMPMHAHRSQPVTAELVRQARQVYVMTRSHLQVVRSLVMDAPADLLDPDGDIADPIGGSEAVYAETARRLVALIEGRLDEILTPLGKD